MAAKRVLTWTCARCTRTETLKFPLGRFFPEPEPSASPPGWAIVGDEDLCPVCSTALVAFMAGR